MTVDGQALHGVVGAAADPQAHPGAGLPLPADGLLAGPDGGGRPENGALALAVADAGQRFMGACRVTVGGDGGQYLQGFGGVRAGQRGKRAFGFAGGQGLQVAGDFPGQGMQGVGGEAGLLVGIEPVHDGLQEVVRAGGRIDRKLGGKRVHAEPLDRDRMPWRAGLPVRVQIGRAHV